MNPDLVSTPVQREEGSMSPNFRHPRPRNGNNKHVPKNEGEEQERKKKSREKQRLNRSLKRQQEAIENRTRTAQVLSHIFDEEKKTLLFERCETQSQFPIVWVKGERKLFDIGTSLQDLRTSFPTAYVVEVDNPARAHAKNAFVLQSGIEYELITPQQLEIDQNQDIFPKLKILCQVLNRITEEEIHDLMSKVNLNENHNDKK